MRPRYPDNGLEVARRRKSGVRLVALAVAVDRPAAGMDWTEGDDTDWIGVLEDAPVGATEFPMVAGLVCVVYGRLGAMRPFAVADRLFKSGALQVWMEQPDGLWRLQRPIPGKPVVAIEGPATSAAVLSVARSMQMRRVG